jgi:ribosome recycling factor
VSEKLEQFRKDMETAKNTTEQLRNDIRQIKQDNAETITQIEDDAKFEIDEINKKNMQN